MMRYAISPGQTVFARWRNGYYYPAIADAVLEDHIQAAFLDGYRAQVSKEHVLELEEAYKTLDFQGNWKHGGLFFKGVIASHDPMIMHYKDGDVEQIELSQLRGKPPKPDKKTANPAPDRHLSATRDRDTEIRLEQLKSLHKSGMLTKEEYKQRRDALR